MIGASADVGSDPSSKFRKGHSYHAVAHLQKPEIALKDIPITERIFFAAAN